MAAPDTSASLLFRIRDLTDAESWKQFGQTYAPIVFRYLTGRGLQDADAGDVTQEVLCEVARCIQNFEYRPESGRFRDWLALVTRRRLYKFWNKRSDVVQLDSHLDIAEPGHDAQWIDVWQSDILRVALDAVRAAMKESTWSAFELTWIKNISAAEVSEKLGMPIDLVYSAKARSLNRLEAELRNLGDDCGWLADLPG